MSAHPYYERHWHESEKRKPRLSLRAKEDLTLAAIAVGSLAGIVLIWWLG